jgi:invasion protein IalB
MRLSTRILRDIAWGLLTSAAAGVALGAADQADLTTAAYGDWVLQCQRAGAQAAAPACELLQTVVAEGQGPIARLALARLSAGQPLKLAVALPLHASFATAPRVTMGDASATAVELVWRRCLPQGCFADGDLSEAVLRQWRAPAAPAAGRLLFQDGTGRPVTLPVSLRGLAGALEALDAQARR